MLVFGKIRLYSTWMSLRLGLDKAFPKWKIYAMSLGCNLKLTIYINYAEKETTVDGQNPAPVDR